jgi:hypothetical protein
MNKNPTNNWIEQYYKNEAVLITAISQMTEEDKNARLKYLTEKLQEIETRKITKLSSN